MLIRFWGTRGSIATPGTATARYGGNTSCTEVRTDSGGLLILDCGTGARQLGLRLLKERPVKANILITHTHWDHIQGFPFFSPAFLPDSEITVYAPTGFLNTLEQTLAGQMQYSYFPVRLGELRSRIRFINLNEGAFHIGDTLVETQFLNHTAPTIGYRITDNGTTVVYATDHEPFAPGPAGVAHPGDQRHVDFLGDADLVIHDAQYSLSEYAGRLGWGHSTVDYATEVSVAAGAERLALYHHEPTHDDATIDLLQTECQRYAATRRSELEVFGAFEGMEVALPPRRTAAARSRRASALEVRSVSGARVVVATADPDTAAQITGVLVPEDIEPVVIDDPATAVRQIQALHPDAVVLDAALFGESFYQVVGAVTSDFRTSTMAVITLQSNLDEATLRRSFAAGVTDCLVTPFSPPMLHARIRAWLSRNSTTRPQAQPGTAIPEPSEAGRAPAPTLAASDRAAAVHLPAPRPKLRRARKLDVLSETHIFGALPAEATAKLARRARFLDFNAGEIISRQGELSGTLYVIAAGRVRVVGRTPDRGHDETLLGEMGTGDIFGELALIDELPHSATVIAAEPTRCLVLDRKDFLNLLSRQPSFGYRMMRLLSFRLRAANRLLVRSGPDALTGLVTRHALELAYVREAAAARRRAYGLALVLVDIDNLKGINQEHGFGVGDEVIRAVADGLRRAVREADIAARSGSDEFIALLQDPGADGSRLVTARIQRCVGEICAQREIAAAVSLKISAYSSMEPPEAFEDLLARAREVEASSRSG